MSQASATTNQGLVLKGRGNQRFANGDYESAVILYKDAARALAKEEKHEDLSKVYSNIAETNLRLHRWSAAEAAASDSLEAHCCCATKAHFRRAKARYHLGNFEAAIEDAKACLPESRNLLQQIKKALDVRDAEKKLKLKEAFGSGGGLFSAKEAYSQKKEISSNTFEHYFPHCTKNNKVEAYMRIIDSYRLRIEDEFIATACTREGTLYDETPLPLTHFKAYLSRFRLRGLLPSWWRPQEDDEALYTMATTDALHTIKEAVNESEINGLYSSTSELIKLREIAELVDGYTLHPLRLEQDDHIQECASEHQFQNWCKSWMRKAPFCPPELLFDQETNFQCIERFDTVIAPYERMTLTEVLMSRHDKALDDFVQRIMISLQFGYEKNQINPEQYARYLSLFALNVQVILKKKLGYDPGAPEHPSDFRFDHYGVVCALALAGFDLLSENEQKSEYVQEQLCFILLSGIFDTPTLVAINNPQWKPSFLTTKDDKPYFGDGVLETNMRTIWNDAVRAPDLVQQAENDRAHEATALQLLCFSEPALRNAYSVFGAPAWYPPGTGSNIFQVFVRLALIVARRRYDDHDPTTALEYCERALSLRTDIDPLYRLEFTFIKVQANDKLSHYAQARCLLGNPNSEYDRGIFLTIERYRKRYTSIPSAALDALLERAHALYLEIKDKVKPLLPRILLQSRLNPAFSTVDCSFLDGMEDCFTDNRVVPKVSMWRRALENGQTVWDIQTVDNSPAVLHEITKLHISIDGGTDFTGIGEAFPNLEALILDDHRECSRKRYDLTPLEPFHGLIHLEIRFSAQWMASGFDVLDPLKHLTLLQKLYISRLRDGTSEIIKALEHLTALRELFYEGQNEYCVQENEPPTRPDLAILDLRQLVHLERCVFIEAEFEATTEWLNTPMTEDYGPEQQRQSLLPPPQLKHITCIPMYESKCTEAFMEELLRAGITLFNEAPPIPLQSDASIDFWKRIEQLSGPWFQLSDNGELGVDTDPCSTLNMRPR